MTDDASYIANYKPRRLYVNPAKGKGAYASICDDLKEEVLGEFDLRNGTRIAVTAFLSNEDCGPRTLKLHLLRHRKNSGWFLDDSIQFNGFEASKLEQLLSLISSVELDTNKATRMDYATVSPDQFFAFRDRSDILERISNDPRLETDVFAIATKRASLTEFKNLIRSDTSEAEWQTFLENNSWIFGFGLDYVFLESVGERFEATTTGASVFERGKRADGFAKTRAQISRTVFIEIKTSKTQLLEPREYRSGVWPVSREVSNAVSQCQRTVDSFVQSNSAKIELTDGEGTATGEVVFAVEPKSFLVVGHLGQFADNTNKVSSFELYRRNLNSPEIITFDELYYRAVGLVDSLAGT